MTTITDRLAALSQHRLSIEQKYRAFEWLHKVALNGDPNATVAICEWEAAAARLTLAVELLRRLARPDYAQSCDWEAPIEARAFLQFIDKERSP